MSDHVLICGKNLREVMYIKDLSDNPWNEISLSDYENHMKVGLTQK